MRRSLAWIGLVLCVLLVGRGGAVARAEEDPSAADELSRVVAFLDGLELPDPTAYPWVRVRLGERSEGGFLLGASETDGSFRILYPDLGIRTLERSSPDGEAHEKVAFEASSLEAYVADALARWGAMTAESYPDRRAALRFGPHLDPIGEAAVLAWMCAKRGLPEAASALWAQARRLDPEAATLDSVKARVALVDLWRIVESFDDLEVSLSEILERLERHVRVFEVTNPLERARIMAESLADQLAETPVPEPAADAPVAERVAYLVDRLTTQHGRQNGQPGWCDSFSDERGEDSPAHQLLALGFDAVPALLEALFDMRFTRSIGYVRNFYFSHHVLRVCDVALDVLSRIAGQGFWDAPYFSEHVSQEERNVRVDVQRRVRAWWAEAAPKGELAALEEEIVRGGRYAPMFARRLLRKDETRGFAALRVAMDAASDAETRGYLVQTLAEVESDEATVLLRRILQGDPSLLVRATAAFALLERSPAAATEAIDAMVAAWQAPPPVPPAPPSFGRSGRDVCREFLQGCGDVRGIRALAEGLGERPVAERVELLTRLRWSGSLAPYTLGAPTERQPRAPAPVLREVEALLASRLTDREAHPVSLGLYSSLHDRFIEPRVCDYAAWVLGELFPDAYAPFDRAACVRVRDQRIAELANVHRARVGEPVLPLPDTVRPPPFDGSAIRVARVEREGVAAEAWGDLGTMLDGLEGEDLTPTAVIDVVLAATLRLDETTNGFSLHVHRDEPHLGIVVKARLEGRSAPWESGGLSHAARIRVGTDTVGGHSGSGARSYVSTREAWADTEAALARMLGAPVEAILDAKLDLSLWPDRK